jgi:hypothetical protein
MCAFAMHMDRHVKVVRRYRFCRCVACFYTEWINDTDDCIPRQYADIARMLSDAGADPNMRETCGYNTSLAGAVQ